MTEVVKSITEAFSMQPVTITIHGDNQRRSASNPESDIKEIRHEKRYDGIGFYYGYNFDGKILFKYLALSVNVHYKIPQK